MEDPMEAYEYYSFNIAPLCNMTKGPLFIEKVIL